MTVLSTVVSGAGTSGSPGTSVSGTFSGSSSLSMGVDADDDIGVDDVYSNSSSESDELIRMIG